MQEVQPFAAPADSVDPGGFEQIFAVGAREHHTAFSAVPPGVQEFERDVEENLPPGRQVPDVVFPLIGPASLAVSRGFVAPCHIGRPADVHREYLRFVCRPQGDAGFDSVEAQLPAERRFRSRFRCAEEPQRIEIPAVIAFILKITGEFSRNDQLAFRQRDCDPFRTEFGIGGRRGNGIERDGPPVRLQRLSAEFRDRQFENQRGGAAGHSRLSAQGGPVFQGAGQQLDSLRQAELPRIVEEPQGSFQLKEFRLLQRISGRREHRSALLPGHVPFAVEPCQPEPQGAAEDFAVRRDPGGRPCRAGGAGGEKQNQESSHFTPLAQLTRMTRFASK